MSKFTLLFLSAVTLLSAAPAAQAMYGDVREFYSFKDEKGRTLSEFIADFAIYGKPSSNSIRVTLIGAVRHPGVYYYEQKIGLSEAIQKAGEISPGEHPVSTYLARVRLYRSSEMKPYDIDASSRKLTSSTFPLADGDVINVLAHKL